MDIAVGIVPYHRSLLLAIDEHYDDIVQGVLVSDVTRRTDLYTMFTIIMKVSTVDSLSDVATLATESIYRQLSLKYGVTMLSISHMVNEIIETAMYQKVRRLINQCVARTSDKHLGVNDVTVTWNMSKVLINVAKR